MKDFELWQLGVAKVEEEYRVLPPALLTSVNESIRKVRECKKAIHAFTEKLDASTICASCGGECCVAGKHHFTVIDLLSHLSDGRDLFAPRFGNGLCPYLGEQGCLMDPEFRPFNCVTFNCERVESLLDPQEIESLYKIEQTLKVACHEIEVLLGNRYMQGLLINYERDVLQHGACILKVNATDS